MHYLALLLGPEPTEEPDAEAQIMAAYQNFHTAAGPAICAGDALGPAADAVRITGGPTAPTVTDGPFVEGAEVAGGYYVLEADNLDDALEIARQIPACAQGAVEVWPIVHWKAPTQQVRDDWLALLLEPADAVHAPDTPQWQAGAARHVELGEVIGEAALGGAPLHPPSTATTVRVRDGKTIYTDGPYAEGAEVANGFYLLRAADRDEAVKLATMIPASAVEVRRLTGISGL
ncbi:YciI family protein [Mycobacterium sp. C31M]